MIEALARRPRARPAGAGRRRQRRLGRGHPRADRGRRRHRQGRRRPGRDVHDPDDDRRRAGRSSPPCSSAPRPRPRARQARLGRRRGPAPARRRPGAGRRRLVGDDRLLVRRHPRVARRPAATTPTGRAYKVSFGMASARAVANRTSDRVGVRPRPQGRSTRRASPRRGCTSTRPAPASRTSSTRSAPASAPPARTPAPRRSPSSASGPSSASSRAAGFHEGRPLATQLVAEACAPRAALASGRGRSPMNACTRGSSSSTQPGQPDRRRREVGHRPVGDVLAVVQPGHRHRHDHDAGAGRDRLDGVATAIAGQSSCSATASSRTRGGAPAARRRGRRG